MTHTIGQPARIRIASATSAQAMPPTRTTATAAGRGPAAVASVEMELFRWHAPRGALRRRWAGWGPVARAG
jgi:hypothetical protein